MASFGEELRRQRELRDVTLREIADATKINIRFLESLEKNDFKHLPGGQFNKGFIRAYARHIGIDGESMVDAYLMEERKVEEADKALGRSAAPRGRRPPRVGLRFVAIAVALLLVAAGAATVGWWLLMRRPAGEPAGARAPASTPAMPSAGATPGASLGSSAAPSGSSGLPGSPAGGAQATADAPPSTAAELPQLPPDPAAEPTGGEAAALSLIVMPIERRRLDLLCDGKRAFSGVLELGRPARFSCPGVFEISTDDAGASNFTVNGERIYLGRRGQAIAGRHVSAANYADYAKAPAETPPR